MADKPILFSGPMVRAMLNGSKTQTRRLFKGIEDVGGGVFHISTPHGGIHGLSEENVPKWAPDYLRIAVGDRLYVREHWRTFKGLDKIAPRDLVNGDGIDIEYIADGTNRTFGKHRQAMHMPRWASRLTLTVTDVRVQRLQDISEADALAEGIVPVEHRPGGAVRYSGVGAKFGLSQHTAKLAYARLWDSINGEDAWAENPWVAAYTFTVQRGNIDAIVEGR